MLKYWSTTAGATTITQLHLLPLIILVLKLPLLLLLKCSYFTNHTAIITTQCFCCIWTSAHGQMYAHKQWKVIVWHMFTYVMTLPGCDSCASLEGRYVLNHSSLININDSGLWSFHCYDGKQWYACTHCESPGMCSAICQYLSRELMMRDLWRS